MCYFSSISTVNGNLIVTWAANNIIKYITMASIRLHVKEASIIGIMRGSRAICVPSHMKMVKTTLYT